MAKVTVKLDEQSPEPVEIIAESIIKIAEGFQKINQSKLNRKAVLLLLHDAVRAQVSKRDIEKVLEAIPELKTLYLKKGS